MYSEQIEKTCLVTAILRKNALHKTIEKLSPDDFQNFANKVVYKSIMYLYKNNIDIDFTVIRNHLIKTNDIKYIKNTYYADLATTDTTINIDNVIESILENSKKLKLKKLSEKIKKGINDNKLSTDIVNKIEKKLFELNDYEQHEFLSLSDIAKQNIEKKLSYYKTCIKDIDSYLVGMFETELHVIGARPGKGKTTYCLHTAMKIAEKYKDKKVLFFSLEMSKKVLETKITLSKTNKQYNLKKVISGNITEPEKQELKKLREKIYQYDNLIIIDKVYDYNKIITMIKSYAQREDISVIFIDYLQLINVKSNLSRHLQVGEISRGLKTLAGDLETCIVCPAQLNRSVEQRVGQIPILADLRESGNIEQDADVIFFLAQDIEMENKNIMKIICAKNRNGATFSTDVYADKGKMVFNSLYKNDNDTKGFFDY